MVKKKNTNEGAHYDVFIYVLGKNTKVSRNEYAPKNLVISLEQPTQDIIFIYVNRYYQCLVAIKAGCIKEGNSNGTFALLCSWLATLRGTKKSLC